MKTNLVPVLPPWIQFEPCMTSLSGVNDNNVTFNSGNKNDNRNNASYANDSISNFTDDEWEKYRNGFGHLFPRFKKKKTIYEKIICWYNLRWINWLNDQNSECVSFSFRTWETTATTDLRLSTAFPWILLNERHTWCFIVACEIKSLNEQCKCDTFFFFIFRDLRKET